MLDEEKEKLRNVCEKLGSKITNGKTKEKEIFKECVVLNRVRSDAGQPGN